MSHFATNRAALAARRSELLRRLTRLEEDLDRAGVDLSAHRGPANESSVASAITTDVLAQIDREIGQVESALRRIDSREYDCCLQCGGTIDRGRLERLPYAVNCGTCSTRHRLDSVELLRGDHTSLRRMIFDVLHSLNDTVERIRSAEPGSPLDVACCHALLADLARHLPLRFEHEERDGHLAEALAVAPRFTPRASALVRQHADFVRRIDALLKDTEQLAGVSGGLTAIRDRFRDFALDLLAHEQSEADVVESAFLDDLGGID